MHLPFIILLLLPFPYTFAAHLAFLLVYSAISVERGEEKQNNRHGLQEVSWWSVMIIIILSLYHHHHQHHRTTLSPPPAESNKEKITTVCYFSSFFINIKSQVTLKVIPWEWGWHQLNNTNILLHKLMLTLNVRISSKLFYYVTFYYLLASHTSHHTHMWMQQTVLKCWHGMPTHLII